ncbi:hypothetical protein [Aeromicrobium sp. CTD01-1L150]|uniref:hypothetical protein n=1 Tax=Aeromicrobium sp. CTD01-1L150 TaxID=3341830 RepID=UPI0035BF9723
MFPNLPMPTMKQMGQPGTPLVSSYTTNVAHVAPARQWIRMVDLKVTADTAIINLERNLATCHRVFGEDSERCVNDRSDVRFQKSAVKALAYPVNFEGDDPGSPPADISELRRFGSEFTHFPPQRVRTLAFGSIPVEATLHLSLTTDENGLPYGIRLDADDYNPSPVQVSDSVGTGRLTVRLSDLRADRVPVDVGDACRTASPAELSVAGSGYESTSTGVPEGHYSPARGGLLHGTISIGDFRDCGTGGEDVSPLVNAMAAGAQMPVRIVQGLVTAPCFTNIVSVPIDESRCNTGGPGEFPDGEQLPPLPPGIIPPPPQD